MKNIKRRNTGKIMKCFFFSYIFLCSSKAKRKELRKKKPKYQKTYKIESDVVFLVQLSSNRIPH